MVRMAQLFVLLVALLAPVDASEGALLHAGDVFAGSYKCGSAAWLLMHVEEVSTAGVKAIFHFLYPGTTQHGAFLLHGKWDETHRRILSLDPGDWVSPPAGKVVKVGLMGIVSEDGLTFSGEVMHGSCSSFQVNRTTLDVALPEATVTFSDRYALKLIAPLDGTDVSSSAASALSWRRHAHMVVNGVGGLVEEARTARRAASDGASPASIRGLTPGPPPRRPATPQPQAQPQQQMGRDATEVERSMEEAAAEEATAVVYPPFAAGEALSDAAARLAEHLWQRLTSRRFEHAYQLWSSSCFTARSGGEEEGRQAARAVIARVLGMRSPFPNRARDASYPQTTHSVPSETAAARTLRHDMLRSLAVFGSYGAEVSRAIAASLRPVTDLDPHAEVLFTEAQLQLALNRSGCRDDDDALRRVESALRQATPGAAQAARAGYLQLIAKRPDWPFPSRRLGELLVSQKQPPEVRSIDEGILHLRKAANSNAHDIFSWVALGDALRASSYIRDALAAYKQAQRWHPGFAHVRRMRQWQTAVEGQLAHQERQRAAAGSVASASE